MQSDSSQHFTALTHYLHSQPEIAIEDAGATAFRRMLEFLYRFVTAQFSPILSFLTRLSGSYESTEADDGVLVLQVLSLSDRYMLPGLKRQCEAVLRSCIDEVVSINSLIPLFLL